MKKSLLFIALLTICNLNAQLFECIGDETAGIGTAGPYLCNGYDLMAQITLTEFDAALDLGPATPPSTGSDSWGWTDPASGREFATPYLLIPVEETFPVIFEMKTVATLLFVLEANKTVP